MCNLTFEIARSRSFGIGISWNRRDIFDYGWIVLSLPFVQLIIEWPPDEEAWKARYETEENSG